MHPRYEDPHTSHLWSDTATVARWQYVETWLARSQARHGLIPAEAAQAIADCPPLDPAQVAGAEQHTGHDLAAFVQVMGEAVGEHGRWVHYGVTSSDIIDTANALLLKQTGEHLCRLAHELALALNTRAQRHQSQQRMARTHGREAEPIYLGDQFKRIGERVARAHNRMVHALDVPMKMSGPVGNYPVTPPEVETEIAHAIGLDYAPDATQVVPRDHYTEWAYAAVDLAGSCERLATEVRLSAQSGVDQISEPFGEEQVGSSSMPHKRNPVRSERLCGLARIARAYLAPLLETADSLWGERDISNSSVERVALRDLATLVAWMLVEAKALTVGLVVHEDNLGGPYFASSFRQLSWAVACGADRNEAHRLISAGQGDLLRTIVTDQGRFERGL